MGIEDFKTQMRDKGWFIFEDVISYDIAQRMTDDLEHAYTHCREIQLQNGLDNTQYTVHHLIGQGQSFMDCLAEYEGLNEYFTAYFGGKYILNSFGGNILSKGMSYANDIHRDIRSYSENLPLMLNTLVMLDEFIPENGATWLMEGGHRYSNKPDNEFSRHAFQVTGKAGSVAVWNSNLWHRAGVNTTDKPRRSVTPELVRPFMKQGFDYVQFVREDDSDWMRQILGFYSRTPSTLNEWYQKDRFYRSDQG